MKQVTLERQELNLIKDLLYEQKKEIIHNCEEEEFEELLVVIDILFDKLNEN